MPTTARPPPASRLKNVGDHSSSSPVNRRRVIARVITAGTRMSGLRATDPPPDCSAIGPPVDVQRVGCRFGERAKYTMRPLGQDLSQHAAEARHHVLAVESIARPDFP